MYIQYNGSMNSLLCLNKDPILTELNSSVDKESTKKMLAFKSVSYTHLRAHETP